MFLVDTNVISALAPSKRESQQDLIGWLNRASQHLFLSVISAAEIEAGIAKARREGATTKAHQLAGWWQSIEHLYADRLLAFDLRCAHAAGAFIDSARAHHSGFEDIAIAATAQVHDLVVLTRNIRHFEPLGIQVANPFTALPELR